MKTKIILLLSVSMLTLSAAFAQEQPSAVIYTYPYRPFQIALVTPLGTNGRASSNTVNESSFNILGGVSYATKVFEAGGLYNVNRGFTRGVQLAGLVNASGHGDGAFQVAGLTNINRNNTGGTQLGGLVNSSATGNLAFQLGGLVNRADQAKTQIAGLVNTQQQACGFQLAGIANRTREQRAGAQIAGVLNAVSNGEAGFQLAGVVNRINGAGLQLAGVANSAVNVGTQIGGVVNVASRVRGAQIGLINISKEMDGVPVGLINIVTHGGKYEVELSFSESLNTALSFKMGTQRLYSILSGGINVLNKEIEFGAGAGLGTHIDFSPGWASQIEAMAYTMTERGSFFRGLNLLTQLKYTVSKEFSPHFKIFFGPTFNLGITNIKALEGRLANSAYIPYSLWENRACDVIYNGWIGLVAGVRF